MPCRVKVARQVAEREGQLRLWRPVKGRRITAHRTTCTEGHPYPAPVLADQTRPVCTVCRSRREALYRAARKTESGAVGLRRLKPAAVKQDFWRELARG